MFSKTSLFSLGALLPLVCAVTHDIKVGDGGLSYKPEAISAEPGDQVVFHFVAKNHTATQSSFAAPCGRKEGGFDSGFQFVDVNQTDNFPTSTYNVTDKNATWFFCQQLADTPGSHCGAGMVFSVNCGPDDAPNSFTKFKESALAIGQKLKESAAASSTSGSGGYGDSTATATDTGSGSQATSTGKEIKVTVGNKDGQLKFDPNVVSAQKGDTLIFEFQQKNHSLVESTFDAPCTPKAGGFSTPFFAVSADKTSGFPTVSIPVNDTNPHWAYCAQLTPSPHCGTGMVFALNPVETSAKNFAAFLELAKGTAKTGTASGASASNSAVSSRGLTIGFVLIIPTLAALLL